MIITQFGSIWSKNMVEWATFNICKHFTLEKIHYRLLLMNFKRFTHLSKLYSMFILPTFNYIFPKD